MPTSCTLKTKGKIYEVPNPLRRRFDKHASTGESKNKQLQEGRTGCYQKQHKSNKRNTSGRKKKKKRRHFETSDVENTFSSRVPQKLNNKSLVNRMEAPAHPVQVRKCVFADRAYGSTRRNQSLLLSSGDSIWIAATSISLND